MAHAGKKVYFPVESLVGLGHFNRTGKLVREMAASGMDVTVASGTFVDERRFFAGAKTKPICPYALETPDGIFYDLDATGKRTILKEFNQQAWIDRRTQDHLHNLKTVRPNIFVSEFWPFDRKKLDPEMVAVLDTLKTSDYNKLRVASVRDVLDYGTHETSAPLTDSKPERSLWAAKTINDHFHAVLVHGDPNFIPLSETFAAADELKTPVLYTGYVIDDLPKRVIPDRQQGTLLVSCGSGADGEEMIYSFLTAWGKLLDRRAAEPTVAALTNRPIHIVCGPRFLEKDYLDVTEWVDILQAKSGSEIKVEKYRNDYTDLLAHAAFSISLAGYNTTLETLALGVPALFVPKYDHIGGELRMSTEQLFRLKRLAENGFASYAHPETVQDTDRFAKVILEEFTTQIGDRKQAKHLNFSGAKNTVATIQDLAKERAAPRPL